MRSTYFSRRIILKKILSLGVGLGFLIGQKTAWAKSAEKTSITSVRVARSGHDHTRVVFDLSKSVEHSVLILENPNRIVIDFKNTSKNTAFSSSSNATNVLKSIRSAPRKQSDLRVVLDLKKKARPHIFALAADQKMKDRLVVDLHATELSPTPIKTHQQQHKINHQKVIIAIDPGHGGKDPGAIGKKGTREKDITLAVAKKLQKLINRDPHYKAVMTRTTDKYVVLRNRVKKARELQADLFVSLHADSFRSAKVEGASVYALSINGASSEAARWMAQKENASDLIGGISLDDKDDMIASVLLDLTQTNTIQSSIELGNDVLNQLSKVGKVNKKEVQQAGFAVLKAPDMPSILVETAFLSNPKEERRLRSKKHQQNLAKAIFSGIKKHIKS